MANSYMADLGELTGLSSVYASKSTSRKNNTSLDMQDFLQLMIVQFQNQTIDNTADTGEILNQMVQMQAIQALTTVNDAVVMQYAGSLVGKEVTIGKLTAQGKLEEVVVTITGTGYSNGEQVIFAGDEMYKLTDIMAIGRLPKEEETDPDEGTEEVPGKPVVPPVDGGTDEEDAGSKPEEVPGETVTPPVADNSSGEEHTADTAPVVPTVVPMAPRTEGADMANGDGEWDSSGEKVSPVSSVEG